MLSGHSRMLKCHIPLPILLKVSSLHNASDIGTKILDHQRLIWLRSRWFHVFPMFGGPTSLDYDEVFDTTPHIDDVREIAERELQELIMYYEGLLRSARRAD